MEKNNLLIIFNLIFNMNKNKINYNNNFKI